jgi:thiosulfate/3-mercaptopyruvate sulfurtransferase
VPFKTIGIAEARDLMARPDLMLLDMRDAASYAAASIGSAVHVSESNLNELITQTPKARPILIYCYHGHASQVYAETFADFGFREVYSLDGGFEQWRAAS